MGRWIVRLALWMLMAETALLFGLAALDYVCHPDGYNAPFRSKYRRHLAVVISHGVAGSLALGVGPLQFVAWLRRRGAHRWLGRAYVACVVTAAVTGIPLSLEAEGGRAGRAGFLVLNVFWLATVIAGWQAARRGRFAEHGRWMTRSYALTFSAILTRLYLFHLQQAGLDLDAIAPYASWLPWTLALGLVELGLRRATAGRRFGVEERGSLSARIPSIIEP